MDMEDEKLLPSNGPAPQAPPPSYFHLENKIAPRPSVQPPMTTTPPATELPQKIILQKPVLPPPPAPLFSPSSALSAVPSPKAQSWGALISIIIIVLMIIVGAFYAWGKRITEENIPPASSIAQ